MANYLKPATRMVAICTGLIALAAIFCFCLSQHYKIEHPVLCKVYGAYYVDTKNEEMNDDLFRIPYLTCKAGEREIESLRFDGMPGLYISEDDEDGDSSEASTFYMRKEFVVSSELGDERILKLTKPVTLTSAVITYKDKTKERINLGEIILYPRTAEKDQPLENNGEAYVGDNGKPQLNILVTKSLQLKSIQLIPSSKANGIKVNNKSIDEAKKIQWKKDQQINLAFEQERDTLSPYEPLIKVTSVTEDGKEHIQYIGPFKLNNNFNNLNFLETIDYLKGRGVL